MFVPCREYRAHSDTDAWLPPFRIIDSTEDDHDCLEPHVDNPRVRQWYAYEGIASEVAYQLSKRYPDRRFTVVNCTGGWVESYLNGGDEDDLFS